MAALPLFEIVGAADRPPSRLRAGRIFCSEDTLGLPTAESYTSFKVEAGTSSFSGELGHGLPLDPERELTRVNRFPILEFLWRRMRAAHSRTPPSGLRTCERWIKRKGPRA